MSVRSVTQAALAAALCWCVSAAGVAQPAPREGFRLERWTSPPTSRDTFAVTLPDVLEHMTWSTQLSTGYAFAPLVLRDPHEHRIVEHRLSSDLTAALGLWERVEVYGRLPVTWLSIGEDTLFEQTRFRAPGGFALGDLGLGATGLVWARAGLQLGGRAELMLPTGDRGELAGDSALAPRVHALLAYTHDQITAALNGGYVYRPQRDYALARVGHELEWGAALRFDTRTDYELSLEAFGSLGLRERQGPGAADTLDVLVGARRRADTGAVRMRVGAAIGGGFSAAAGDPRLRALLTVGVEPRPREVQPATPPADRDGDGLVDEHDECPRDPEDPDAFQDEDGCPDDDNDRDGVLDALDTCPLVAGEDARGCPAPDADGDGIPDDRDRCPQDPEDPDGDRDEDGCPERDSDGDGLTDDADACPDVPGPAEAHGCRLHARFQRDRIALREPVRFEGTTLPEAAQPMLEDVAVLLRARPQVRALLKVVAPSPVLAAARANALLEALVTRGVAAERLSAEILAGPSKEWVEIRLQATSSTKEPSP